MHVISPTFSLIRTTKSAPFLFSPPEIHNHSIPSHGPFDMRGKGLTRIDVGRTVSRYVCADCRLISTTLRQSRWRPGAARPQELGSKTWIRGAKRKSTLTVKTVPQGSLPAKVAETVDESDGPAYPTVVQQARNNMRKFSHCVLLTRVGNFYEVFPIVY
jgi:hypothetical protein